MFFSSLLNQVKIDLSKTSGVCHDGDPLLHDGGLALAAGQPELGAEEDILPVGVEVHRQRDDGLKSQRKDMNYVIGIANNI